MTRTGEGRRRALDRALAEALSGHPDASWSVVLDARLVRSADGARVLQGVRAAAARLPGVGPLPELLADVDPLERAQRPFEPGGSLVRVLLGEDGTRLTLAAHHAMLDGIGLLALLGSALGEPLSSDVRGIDPATGRPPALGTTVLRRVVEAIARPASRAVPSLPPNRARREPGDLMVARTVDHARTGALVAGTADAVARWNAQRGGRLDRLVINVGASLRPGATPTLEDRSAYLRVAPATADAAAMSAAVRGARPQPGPPRRGVLGWLARPATRLLSERMGPTALVSSIGRVGRSAALVSLGFYPVAHGRGGLAVGMATVGDRTTVTVRCRRADFGAEDAEAIADLIASALPPPAR